MSTLAVVPSKNQVTVDREALARKVAEGFQALSVKLADFEKDIRALWEEFKKLAPGETILAKRVRETNDQKFSIGREQGSVVLDGYVYPAADYRIFGELVKDQVPEGWTLETGKLVRKSTPKSKRAV